MSSTSADRRLVLIGDQVRCLVEMKKEGADWERIEPCNKLLADLGTVACSNGHKHHLVDLVAASLDGSENRLHRFMNEVREGVTRDWIIESARRVADRFDRSAPIRMPAWIEDRPYLINGFGLIPLYAARAKEWYFVENHDAEQSKPRKLFRCITYLKVMELRSKNGLFSSEQVSNITSYFAQWARDGFKLPTEWFIGPIPLTRFRELTIARAIANRRDQGLSADSPFGEEWVLDDRADEGLQVAKLCKLCTSTSFDDPIDPNKKATFRLCIRIPNDAS